MSRQAGNALTPEMSDSAVGRITEELARRRMTRQQLAAVAKISFSTLEKALSGRRPLTLTTLVRLEEALGVSLRQQGNGAPPEPEPAMPGQAPDTLGSYSRKSVAWLEGEYLTLRPSFGEPSAIYAYLTRIRWDKVASSLVFSESERVDSEYAQGGVVSAPHYSGHIYLITNMHGQYRLIIVSRPTIKGTLHGIMTTLHVGRGSHLTPAATPIVLSSLKSVAKAEFGRINTGHPCYAQYRAYLRRTVEEPFALFLNGI
jgi:transcriptional regulator with XRE-family HTH domain